MKAFRVIASLSTACVMTWTPANGQGRGGSADAASPPRPAPSSVRSIVTAPVVAPMEAFSGNDAYLVTKALEPAGMAKCNDRNGTAGSNCLYVGMTTGVFATNFEFNQSGTVRIGYQYSGCLPDKRACKALKLSLMYDSYLAQQMGEPYGGPPAVKAWNAKKRACLSEVVIGQASLFTIVPLTNATSLSAIKSARAGLVACKSQFEVFLKSPY